MKNKLLAYGFVGLLGTLLVLSLCLNTGIYAATTGKVQGTIVDAESNEPLPGVNIVIEGTTFGAAADESGFFFVINVPPGTYNLKATIVGYAIETKEDVRVFVDRTTTANFNMRTQAVAGEEVTVTAERVPVPLDVSSTEAYISGEEVAESATTRFDEMMAIQAGINLASNTQVYTSTEYSMNVSRDRVSGYNASKYGEGFSVRGGGISETDVQIDGLSMTDEISRIPTVAISRNLIQDVQILTGGFNAEYGNIRSGLINVITKDGSYNRYSGVLEGRMRPAGYKHFGDYGPFDIRSRHHEGAMRGTAWSDAGLTGLDQEALDGWTSAKVYDHEAYVEAYEKGSGDSYLEDHPYERTFVGWTQKADEQGFTPTTAVEVYKWVHRPWDYGDDPDYFVDIGGGGPIPYIPRTKFYTSHVWNKSQYPIPQARTWSTELASTGKITSRIRSNMNLTLNYVYTSFAGLGSSNINTEPTMGYVSADRSNMSYVDLGNVYWETVNNPKYVRQHMGSVKFLHTYSPSTYYDIEIGMQRGFLEAFHMRDRDLTKIKFLDDPLLAASGYQEINYTTGDNLGYADGRIGIDEVPRGWYITDRSNGVVSGNDQLGYRHSLTQFYWMHNNNTRSYIKGNYVSQVNKYNQIKAGFEFINFHINRRGFQRSTGSPAYSYDPTSTHFNFIFFDADPRQLDAYIQNKLEWEGMIVNFGLRATYWDPNMSGFNVTEENQYSNLWSSYAQWGSVEGEGNWQFQQNQTRKIKNKVLLQPRVGISHPITTSSKIFFNYGHFYQRPDPKSMFWPGGSARAGGSEGTNGTGFIPSPDLPWPKTISYEIGYSQSIYNQVLLQISGYYKDATNEYATQQIQNYFKDVWYWTQVAQTYRDTRGLEFRLERSFGRFLNFMGNYNYMMLSQGTTELSILYQDQTKLGEQWYNFGQPRVEARPEFRASVTLRTPVGFGPGPEILGVKPLAEWRANMVVTWRDGGEFVYDDDLAPRDWQYVERINSHMWNFYVNKRIARGASIYLNIQNLFNIKYLRTTSGYSNSLRYPWTDPKGNDKYGEYDKYYQNTWESGDEWYKYNLPKRNIYFGVRYQF